MAADKVFWPNYLFFVDFSADTTELAAIPLGELSAADATLVAASLSSHDTGKYRADWNDKEDTDYTLVGATVLFNGDNHTGLPSNALFKKALILRFAWADAVNVLVLQYNPAQ